ncbi:MULTISPECIES: zinc-binding dehydrogenase [unclassified Haladaptatus]|uniref:zinc-dependent alcohol dehydrogenase n=1 Tax=unclassified Haladaptatus TaxID=2622732 RepID=UPI0023E8A250|nr:MULTISPECIES: alcohol dehydrogenase catalytic domain-containing protein [unclassified Haladaptatus]
MRAIIQTERERGGIEFGEHERSDPAPDEALVKVHTAGLCGSDAHAYKYTAGFEWIPVPRVMGHEYSGEVVEVGENVVDLQPGDKVVESPIHDCGHCFQCKNDQSNVCANFKVTGMHNDGCYTEYTTVGERHLHKVPEAVPLDEAAITEPTSIAARAVLERGTIQPGQNVLVEGPGPIGILTGAIADARGANVVVSGLGADTKYRLPLAQELGLETVDIENEDLDAFTENYTDGIGFDAIFDTTGHPSGVENAAEQIRRGGEIIVIGLPTGESEVFFTPLVRGEVDVNTSYGSTWRNFEQALRLIENGDIDAKTIMDTSYSVEEPVEAFEDFLAGETCKPVFRFWD